MACMRVAKDPGSIGAMGSMRREATGDRFDLLIADVHMPRRTGLGPTTRIRHETGHRVTSILVLTIHPSPDVRATGKAAGAEVWMRGPSRPSSCCGQAD